MPAVSSIGALTHGWLGLALGYATVQGAMLPGMWRSRAAPHRLRLAGVPVGAADETKHFKFVGTTGTGKSTAIAELLGAALARGDRAVIADLDGSYLQRFHDERRGDPILNPFDPRSVKWDLLAEIRAAYDVEQLPDLAGYLKLASRREWLRVQLAPVPVVQAGTHESCEL